MNQLAIQGRRRLSRTRSYNDLMGSVTKAAVSVNYRYLVHYCTRAPAVLCGGQPVLLSRQR